MTCPIGPAYDEPEGGWKHTLGYVFKMDVQIGSDYLSVHGPLGFFMTGVYDADLFHHEIAWEVATSLAFAIIFVELLLWLRGRSRRVFFLLILVAFLPLQKDSLYLVVVVSTSVLCIRHLPLRWSVLVVGIALLAILSAVKFTFLALSWASSFLIAARAWREGSWRYALSVPCLFGAFFAVVWIVCGQDFAHLPDYVLSSIELSRGYNEAMAKSGRLLELALAIVVLCGFAILVGRRCVSMPRSFDSTLAGLVLLAGLFVAWKHGFVRSDRGHNLLFFQYAAAVSFLIPSHALSAKPRKRRDTGFHVVLCLIVLCSIVGILRQVHPDELAVVWQRRTRAKFRMVTSLSKTRERFDRRFDQIKREHSLPGMRRAVGPSSVDVFLYDQAALLLNAFNWHPRPTSSAYTPRLLERDAEFYRNKSAPEFVILTLRSIDRRFPTMDGCRAFLTILRHYEPVMVERDYLLLRREPGKGVNARELTKSTVNERVLFGETVDLPLLKGNLQVVRFDIRYSAMGHLLAIMHRPPAVFLEVAATDGSRKQYRVLPGLVKAGFIINPLILKVDHLVSWYHGRSLKEATSLRLLVDRRTRWCFRAPTSISITCYQATVPRLNLE